MNDYLVTILIMVCLVCCSGYFSATETAFSSLSRTRLKSMADSGNKKAEKTLEISEDYDRLLSTILLGNNIVNIGLASLGTLLFVKLFGDVYGATISTIVITVVVLLFGEISPKSLAKENPEDFAMAVSGSISTIIIVLKPMNVFFAWWKRMLSRVFDVKSDRRITHNELLTLVEEVEQGGGIDKNEGSLLRNAIEFNDLDAADILTPRVDIVGINICTAAADIGEIFIETGFSRLPVYSGSMDNIVGIIHQKDFYSSAVGDDIAPAETMMKEPLFITPSTKLSDLLRMLQLSKSHIAVVADEYGGTMGIVTMEDILEELVGEIWDEHDEVIEEFEKIDDNKYKIICSVELYKLFDHFSIKGEAEVESATVSGWVMEMLEHFPEEGDKFTHDGLEVTVTKTDRQRILEIEVLVLEDDIEI